MDYINQLIFPPSEGHLLVARFLLVVTLVVHFAYIGFAVGASMISLFLNVVDRDTPNANLRRFAKYLIDLGMVHRGLVFFVGIVPIPVVALLYAQNMYQTSELTALAFVVALPLVVAGFCLLFRYKASWGLREKSFLLHLAPGVLGLGVLTVAYFIILSGVSLSMDPEKWPFITNPYNFFMFSWNNMIRFLRFPIMAFAVTGSAVLFFYFNWPEGEKLEDEQYSRFVRYVGGGLTLGACAVLPVFVVWNLITLPNVALSLSLYGTCIILVALLACAAGKAFGALVSPARTPGAGIFITILVTLALLNVADSIAHENAISDHTSVLLSAAQTAKLEREAKREAAAPAKGSVAEGEQVFKKVCATCHRFDRKVVGPPYDQTLPQYVGHQDQLEAFIRQPSKKNPEYPPMPQLGLRSGEVQSVAMYLMQSYQNGAGKKK